jgi:hypothetical protein
VPLSHRSRKRSRPRRIGEIADLDAKYRPHFEPLLDGQELRGLCIASQQKGMFKGGAVAIAVTDRCLLVQSLDRRGNPDGQLLSIRPEQVASAKAGPAGGGWITVDAIALDHAAVRLQIATTDGERLKLMLMRGEGRIIGGLGGGESQRLGVRALGDWFSRLPPRDA